MTLLARWRVTQLCVVVLLASASHCVKHHYIHWNSTNPIFRIDNTDHIIDVNAGNLPMEFDQANFICPNYKRGRRSREKETYIIYNVSKEEYETCRISGSHPKIVAVCDKPEEVKYFTITFRSFSPTPGGLEFKPGHDYYFISTSSSRDLERKVGGRCSTHNMRLVFKVADNRPQLVEQEQSLDFQEEDQFPRESDYYYTSLRHQEDGNGLDPSSSSSGVLGTRDSEGGVGGLIKQEASRMQHSVGVASSSSSSSSSFKSVGGSILLSFCAAVLLASPAAPTDVVRGDSSPSFPHFGSEWAEERENG